VHAVHIGDRALRDLDPGEEVPLVLAERPVDVQDGPPPAELGKLLAH
jgi:hypothetical protein